MGKPKNFSVKNLLPLLLVSILLLPIFSLDRPDIFGLTEQPLFSKTNIFKLLRLCLTTYLGVILVVYGSRCKNLFNRRNNLILISGLLYIFLVSLSTLANNNISLKSMYRLSESSINIFLVIFFSIYLEARFDLNRLKKVYFNSLAFIPIFISVVLIVAALIDFNSIIFDYTQGRKRLGGLLYHPNRLSEIVILTFPAVFFVKSWWLRISAGSLGVLILIGTQSRTSLALFVLEIFLITLLIGSKNLKKITYNFACLSLFFLAIGLLNVQFFINILGFGNNPIEEIYTLNNRVYIYKSALIGIQENPVLGVGFSSGVQKFFKTNYSGEGGFIPLNAHNISLELLLANGIIPGTLIIVSLLLFFILCTMKLKVHDNDYKLLWLIFLLTMMFGAISMPMFTTFRTQNNIFIFALCILALSLFNEKGKLNRKIYPKKR